MSKGVQLEGLHKNFGSATAVSDLSLTIHDGELFVLLGPSGCGKTTTLRMVAGLERPTAGRIFIDGQNVTRLEPRRRDIAMVFQDYGLYPHLLVRDNIGFPLKIRKIDRAERLRKIEEVAERLHIAHLLDRKPSALSGGEKQRVSLARALVRNPKVFLMDEPLSNLDAKLRTSMRAEIKRLVYGLGITTIYVTHDQIEAMALATRIGVMDRGRMVQIGTPQEVYDRPADKFVAQFIGSPPMNLFNGEISGDERIDIKPEFLAKVVAKDRVRTIAALSNERVPVVLGIRPEDVHIVGSTDSNGAIGKVELVEPLGQDTNVYLSVNGVELVAVTKRGNFTVGEVVGIRIDPESIHLIDGNSGRIFTR